MAYCSGAGVLTTASTCSTLSTGGGGQSNACCSPSSSMSYYSCSGGTVQVCSSGSCLTGTHYGVNCDSGNFCSSHPICNNNLIGYFVN